MIDPDYRENNRCDEHNLPRKPLKLLEISSVRLCRSCWCQDGTS